MKIISRVLLFFMIISLLLFAASRFPALAQTDNEPSGFKNLRLWIYPEYDDPRLLVMLEGQIEGVPAPARVRFLVPSAAEMYSAGSIDAQGTYSGGPPDRQKSTVPGWDEISYEVNTDTFRVEYYDPGIIGQPEKSIAYEFRPLFPISGLTVIILEPRSATDFSVSPVGRPFVDSEGFNSFQYNYSSLDKGSTLSFAITYKKSDARPSLEITGNGDSGSSTAYIILIIFGIALIGIFFWMRQSRTKKRTSRRPQSRNHAAPKQSDSQPKARFCSQCGKPADASDIFCSHCGAKLTRQN